MEETSKIYRSSNVAGASLLVAIPNRVCWLMGWKSGDLLEWKIVSAPRLCYDGKKDTTAQYVLHVRKAHLSKENGEDEVCG